MFTSPLASLAGWTWSRTVTTDLPKALRQMLPPSAAGTPGPGATPVSEQFAVAGTGPSTSLRFPAAGRWQHAQAEGSTVHWIWGRAADVALFQPLRTRLPWGNPVVALRFEDPIDVHDFTGEPKGVARGDDVDLGSGAVTATGLTVLAFAPGAPGLDTIGVLRHLRDALVAASVTSGSPTWQDFVADFDGLVQPLRVLEPGGSPAAGLTVRLAGGGGPVTLAASHRGDLLSALGIARSDLAAGPTLDVANGAEVVATTGGMPFPTGAVPLTPATSHVNVAPLDAWFAPQQSPVLQRFSRHNTVVPFVDGVATYANMFAELEQAVEAATDGRDAGFYVTGYSLQQAEKLGPSGQTVADVAADLADNGGEARFLALQMIQLDPTWVRDVETAVALIGAILSMAGGFAAMYQDEQSSEQLSFFIHTQAIAYALIAGSASLDSIIEGFELNRADIEALQTLTNVEAHLDPVDADVDDNPHATTTAEFVAAALQAQRRFNVFHQKIQIVRNDTGIHAYCGGIDMNANRTQDGDHASRGPFHDVHARVNGRAADELVTTFSEQWARAAGTALELDAAGPTPDDEDLPDVVQVARTYYGPLPGSDRGFAFAENGERTIIDTLLQAIARARRYIYIEDQYLTPPVEFASALAAAASRVAGPLVIVIPGTPDQPFGFARRQAFLQQMSEAWGDRFKIGLLRKRFSRTPTSSKAAHGRLWLAAPLGEADDVVELGPRGRLPDPPFWLVVDGEAMRAYHKVPGFESPTGARYDVDRAGATNLFRVDSGTERASHNAGAAVVTGAFPDIYVHSKIMLVDDAFASIGSANCNRRGYYSDGECNLMAMRESVADGDDNWIRALRVALWTEHLGLTPDFGRVALVDPVACLPLFDRKFTTGSRFTPFDAQPYTVDLELATEFIDTTGTLGGLLMIGKLAAAMGAAIAGSQTDQIFDSLVDPGSQVE